MYIVDQKNRDYAMQQYGKKNLCKECAGTGNALYIIYTKGSDSYYYRKCPVCDGLGVTPEKLKELRNKQT